MKMIFVTEKYVKLVTARQATSINTRSFPLSKAI